MGTGRGGAPRWPGATYEGTRAALGCNPVAMPKAVRFERYGDVDVLQVVDVARPVPGHDQAVVRVRAAGINPGEAAIRTGLLHERWPATFPSGQGSDLAGVVDEVGDGVTDVSVGDEVIGFTHERASQAELVAVDAEDLTPRPPGVPWDVAGALFVAGSTAYAAVQAVAPTKDDTVVVSGAAGGVGTVAVQLARLRGATVLGLASPPHHGWLRDHGIVPVDYGDGVQERLRKAAGGRVDAFVDTFGSGYVDVAVSLGVAPERIDTIVDWPAARRYGTKTDGNMVGASAEVLAELAGLIDAGRLDVPIARTYPLAEVQAAYRQLEQRHTLGKIVLIA
jgi:NADPH:quinone reductase-like Zn-dependent oxidoreductase